MAIRIINGCCLSMLARITDKSINCCVTSPPYFGLRDYGMLGQLGLEPTPEEYVAAMVRVFREVRRVLKDDGTLWLNLGDSYANVGKSGGHTGGKHSTALHDSPIGRNKRYTGLKPKDLIGIPWRVAFALQADGWILRQDIIWNKPNPMPESVTDRPTKSHEYIFLFCKKQDYYYDQEAIKEPAVWDLNGDKTGKPKLPTDESHKATPTETKNGIRPKTDKQRGHSRKHVGFNERWDKMKKSEQCSGMRNKRSVWTIATKPYSQAHFATYPPDLIEPCILAGSPKGGTVLDPFIGAGTTALVADRLGRDCIGIELNPEYVEIAKIRLSQDAGMFADIMIEYN